MDWHRRSRIITSLFVAGIILLTAIAGVSSTIARHMVGDSHELATVTDRTEDTTQLLVALIDIETGVRGYLLAADPAYLDPYYRGNNLAQQTVEALGPEVESWTAPGLDGETLGTLMAQRAKLMDDILTTAQTRGIEAARVELANSDAKPTMDKIRRVLAQAMQSAGQETDGAERHQAYLAELNAILTVATLAVAVLFSITKFMLFRNEIRGRGQVEQVLRRRNDERRQTAELSSALQLSDSRLEAYEVIAAYARRILPEVSGAFYVYTASRDQLSLVAEWAEPGAASGFVDYLHPAECWGLRQGGRHDGCASPEENAVNEAAPINCRQRRDR